MSTQQLKEMYSAYVEKVGKKRLALSYEEWLKYRNKIVGQL